MSGKTNLVMFLFGLFVAVVAARSLDLRDFKEPQPATNEQNFEDLVNEVSTPEGHLISFDHSVASNGVQSTVFPSA
ncbi:hypothetical protein HOLleu_38619 [Holothuria leucospilota]|uniref:Uncharacterized protein n=1 Tax=Holothuria leucospilota TaxID=206669 RepID=A0A9Q1BB51_HOLLE|nr:hypothetical protein HOLleu_38619 [Holothuria leucospilota]